MFLAESLSQVGEVLAARTEAERALEEARKGSNHWATGVILRTLAEIESHIPSTNWARVEDMLIESTQLLRRVRARPDLARTYLSLRRLYDRAGQIAWAVDCHFRAITIFDELDLVEELRAAQGQAAGDRKGAIVISGLQLRGPNTIPENE
jgi:hypothetical protein